MELAQEKKEIEKLKSQKLDVVQAADLKKRETLLEMTGKFKFKFNFLFQFFN